MYTWKIITTCILFMLHVDINYLKVDRGGYISTEIPDVDSFRTLKHFKKSKMMETYQLHEKNVLGSSMD